MKSLVQYIIENSEAKQLMKTPKDVLITFADDINKAYEKPKEYISDSVFGKCKKEVLKNFWTNFSHNNVMSNKHFKCFTPNIDFFNIIRRNNFSESLVELANSKIDTDGSARYLICVYDKEIYSILCIDLLEHEFAGIVSGWNKKDIQVYASTYDEKNSVKDFEDGYNVKQWALKGECRYILLSDEFYVKK